MNLFFDFACDYVCHILFTSFGRTPYLERAMVLYPVLTLKGIFHAAIKGAPFGPPHKTNVNVAKCHACHAKVPWRHGRPSRPKRVTRPSHVSEEPPLPRKTAAMCQKCHSCHAKRTWMSKSATPATQKCPGGTGDQADPSASPGPAMCQK